MKKQWENPGPSTANLKEDTMSMSIKVMKNDTITNEFRDKQAEDFRKLSINRLLIIVSCILIGAGLIMIAVSPHSAVGPVFLLIGVVLTFGYATREVYS